MNDGAPGRAADRSGRGSLAALLRIVGAAGLAWALGGPLRSAAARLAERMLAWVEGPGYAMALRSAAAGLSVSSALPGVPAHLGVWESAGLEIPVLLALAAAALAPARSGAARVSLVVWALGLGLLVMAVIAAVEIDVAVANLAAARWGLALHEPGALRWRGWAHGSTDVLVLALPALLAAMAYVDARGEAAGGLGRPAGVAAAGALLGVLALGAALPPPAVGRGDVLRLLERARNLNPTSARPYEALARASLAAGRPRRAIAAYRRGLALEPRNARLRTLLAVELAARGGLEQAERELRAAVAAAPSYAAAWRGLALVREAHGDPCSGASALAAAGRALGRPGSRPGLERLRARLEDSCSRRHAASGRSAHALP